MTRFLFDTNIIRNFVKPEPSPSLLAWMGAQKDQDLLTANQHPYFQLSVETLAREDMR